MDFAAGIKLIGQVKVRLLGRLICILLIIFTQLAVIRFQNISYLLKAVHELQGYRIVTTPYRNVACSILVQRL
jgi:hypothetical protein